LKWHESNGGSATDLETTVGQKEHMKLYLYTKYRRFIAALFAHLSQEFRKDLEADLERVAPFVKKQTEGTKAALRQELTAIEKGAQAGLTAAQGELAAIREELANARIQASDDLAALKSALESRLDQLELHVETLDMKKYGPHSSIRYSNKATEGV
jgi:hypothetical protein